MTIVMGLDQHRAQITAEWIDTATGEVSRQRVAPAHRAGVRRFAERFRDQDLEGIVAKRKDSIYESGERSGAWQKLKLENQQEFVVGGYRPGSPRYILSEAVSGTR